MKKLKFKFHDLCWNGFRKDQNRWSQNNKPLLFTLYHKINLAISIPFKITARKNDIRLFSRCNVSLNNLKLLNFEPYVNSIWISFSSESQFTKVVSYRNNGYLHPSKIKFKWFKIIDSADFLLLWLLLCMGCKKWNTSILLAVPHTTTVVLVLDLTKN